MPVRRLLHLSAGRAVARDLAHSHRHPPPLGTPSNSRLLFSFWVIHLRASSEHARPRQTKWASHTPPGHVDRASQISARVGELEPEPLRLPIKASLAISKACSSGAHSHASPLPHVGMVPARDGMSQDPRAGLGQISLLSLGTSTLCLEHASNVKPIRPVSRLPLPPCQRLAYRLITLAADAQHPQKRVRTDVLLRAPPALLGLKNRVAKIPPRVRPSKDPVERVDEQMTSGVMQLSLTRSQCRSAEPILCKPSARKLQCQNRKFVSPKRLV